MATDLHFRMAKPEHRYPMITLSPSFSPFAIEFTRFRIVVRGDTAVDGLFAQPLQTGSPFPSVSR